MEQVFTLQDFVEVAGSRSDLLESTRFEDLQGERRVEEEPGAAQTDNEGELAGAPLLSPP